uniref:Response regulatory domain-containing protein n=1 Tax=Oryza punctata TaxID=4537 RepID=A0A0E0LQ58_ORYPU
MGTAHHNQTAGSVLVVGDANDAVPGPGGGGGGYSDPDGGPTSGVQPPPQVYWERFIQKKTIKVLLVESDDSTRQVVSALLRHCMYEGLSLLSSSYHLSHFCCTPFLSVYLFIFIPAENGQQAWTYLEDMQNSIDLVLTEVVVPGVSGISLLSRIMNHNICKNVPVIMMSSNDAMGTVFKCLSKGAVDFLVKPIRKNELKNLWQHVWRRRCQSSSGSGSESGIQTQKCAKSKSGDESDNNSGSNDDDDDDDGVSMGLNARDGSDNGSGTQSSWTKRAVEFDSPQAMSPDQLADPPDSTCAQVIHPKSEICNDFKGKDLEIGSPRNLNTAYQSSPNERSIKPTDRWNEYPLQNNSKDAAMENLEEPSVRAADLIGSMAKNMDAQQAARATNAPSCSTKVPEGKDKHRDNIMPSLELSLKRSRSTGDGANAIQEEQRNVLRRSDLSAFTRYHTPVASNQGGTGLVGSCSQHDNSSEAMKTDSTYNMKSNSDAAPIKQGSNGSSNNNDMGSTTKNVVTKPSTNKERVMSPSAVKANGHTSAFHPAQHWTSPANTTGKEKTDEVTNNAAKRAQPGEVQSNLVQHPRPILHYVHFDVSRENGGSGAPQCGSSNVFDPPVEGHAANYGVNGSNSGSNNGSNGQNGSTTAVNAERPNMESANGTINKSGPGGGNGSGSGSGNYMYMKRFTQREHRVAAVIKFRQKRKDRNFGKKVRYQSRKRLAEQRPRVRGQFVRQAVQDQQQQGGGREAAADR